MRVFAPRAGSAGLIASLAKWGLEVIDLVPGPSSIDVGRYVITNPGLAGPGFIGKWTLAGDMPNPAGWSLIPLALGTRLDLPAGVYTIASSGFAISGGNGTMTLTTNVPNFTTPSQFTAAGSPLSICFGATVKSAVPWELSLEQNATGPITFQGTHRMTVTRIGNFPP